MTYQDYDNLKATIEAGFVAIHNGRTAHDDAGLRFIAKAEGFDPDADLSDVEDPAEIDAASERLRGESTPTPAETPNGQQTGSESTPGAKDEGPALTPSGLDPKTVGLIGKTRAQIDEIATALGLTIDADVKYGDVVVLIQEARAKGV